MPQDATFAASGGRMAAFKELLGPTLIQNAFARLKKWDVVKTEEVLAGKKVGLLFAASWDQASKELATTLKDIYRLLREEQKPFEIILCSSDTSDESFTKFFAEQPWLALPFAESLKGKVEKLTQLYTIRQTPAFLVFNEDGSLLNRDGRSSVLAGGFEKFPWAPPSLEEALGPTLINSFNDKVPCDSVIHSGKYIALYFSASWCPPCRNFTPMLAEALQYLRSEGSPVEVVLISSDHNEDEFERSRRALGANTYALPFSEQARKTMLSNMFDTLGVPTLVLLDKDHTVVNRNARALVERRRQFPWAPKLVPEVDEKDEWEGNPADVPTLVILEERAGGYWEKTEATMAMLAKEQQQQQAGMAGPPQMLFMQSKDMHGIGKLIRRMARLGEAGSKPVAVLLELNNRQGGPGGYYIYDGELTPDNIRAFLAAYREGKLQKQVGGVLETLTVTAAMTKRGMEDENMEDVNPAEVILNCLLCPILCPLRCAFNCCLGCCLLTAVGTAMGVQAGQGQRMQ